MTILARVRSRHGSGSLSPSKLQHLVEASPISPEDFGTSTREMIALRCLELYFGTDNEVANDVPSVTRPRRAFDFSESCEVVLDVITKETPESAYPDPSKWDIQPFIAHKRASRPKCTLEKLKDAILDGTHPYAASLAELGGLRMMVLVMAPEAEGRTVSLPLENKNGMMMEGFHTKVS
ncbi:hypothetical protein GH714_032628 [Hevea brasiliensis]|uniref:Uncharacterized protein n=1 Tax=Hevea brasiliensis TaxID=3981 RepID=A0A6A6M3J0_HEVBR|nr:hypothetical protein GH714_032628 [Hevea brasiliensis]